MFSGCAAVNGDAVEYYEEIRSSICVPAADWWFEVAFHSCSECVLH